MPRIHSREEDDGPQIDMHEFIKFTVGESMKSLRDGFREDVRTELDSFFVDKPRLPVRKLPASSCDDAGNMHVCSPVRASVGKHDGSPRLTITTVDKHEPLACSEYDRGSMKFKPTSFAARDEAPSNGPAECWHQNTHRNRQGGEGAPLIRRLIFQSDDDSLVTQTETDIESTPSIRNKMDTCLARFLFHPATEIGCCFSSGLYAVWIGVEIDYRTRYNGESLPEFVNSVNIAFAMQFLVEVVLKIAVLRLQFIIGSEWHWNIFDAVVCTQILTETCGMPSTHLGVLRVLRLVRIGRVVRILRFVSELRTIVSCIAASMRLLFWALLLLLIVMYAAAICFTQAILDYDVVARAHLRDNTHEHSSELVYWFGSVARSTLTLFECIASGVSWDEVVRPLIVDVSPVEGLCLTGFIAFVCFAVLNVVTGVVLDKAVTFAHKAEDRVIVDSIMCAFKLDRNDVEREISWEEFEASTKTGEMAKYFESIDVHKLEARSFFDLVDDDSSGGLNAVELITSLMRLRGPATAIGLASMTFELKRLSKQLLDFSPRLVTPTRGNLRV